MAFVIFIGKWSIKNLNNDLSNYWWFLWFYNKNQKLNKTSIFYKNIFNISV